MGLGKKALKKGSIAMQLRVYATEVGSVGPARMAVNVCLGQGAKTGGAGSRTAEGRLLSHSGAGSWGREIPERTE